MKQKMFVFARPLNESMRLASIASIYDTRLEHKILGTFDDVDRACGPIRMRREYDPLDGTQRRRVPTDETTCLKN